MATTYTTGSLFRFYKEDGTHYTAVLLKDGKVLEVKNPETGEKKIFTNLVEWREARGADEKDLVVDTARKTISKPVSTEESLAMKYPKNNKKINILLRWYYDIMKECNPEMLDNEEIIKAYNKLVDVCHKYYDGLSPSYRISRKRFKYSRELLSYTVPSQWNKWGGFPAGFSSEVTYYYQTTKSDTNFDVQRQEILDAYKPFYDLIHKDIHKFMQKKEKERITLAGIKDCKARIAKIERTIARVTSRYTKNLTYYKNKLEELEKSLEN